MAEEPGVLTFVATMTVKPEHDEDFVRRMAAFAELVRANEPDTLMHVVHRHPTEPHTFVAVERYRHADAWTAHAEAPYFREVAVDFQKWLAKPPAMLSLGPLVSEV